jgi:hypothetical protein
MLVDPYLPQLVKLTEKESRHACDGGRHQCQIVQLETDPIQWIDQAEIDH